MLTSKNDGNHSETSGRLSATLSEKHSHDWGNRPIFAARRCFTQGRGKVITLALLVLAVTPLDAHPKPAPWPGGEKIRLNLSRGSFGVLRYQLDPLDSCAWLDSLSAPHREFDFDHAIHDYRGACDNFLARLSKSVSWILSGDPGSRPPARILKI